MTTKQIEIQIRLEMKPLSDKELLEFAKSMGVLAPSKDRNEIEDACVTAEIYAFTH